MTERVTVASAPEAYRFGRFEVRPGQRLLLELGQPLAAGGRALDTLLVLLQRRGEVVTNDELLDLVWPGLVVEENNLRQQVAALRKLLGPQAVVTVPGRGYRLGVAVQEEPTGGRSPRGAEPPGNLPLDATPLIGREDEAQAIVAILATTRLLTLTGAGGVGKTRLAREVARMAASDHPDGTWLVELAPVADPALVVRTVASALRVHEEADRPLWDTLLEFLRRKRLLVVLDNCEHLVDACARCAEGLLQNAAQVRILATSREALGVEAERLWRVPSLASADPMADLTPQQLMRFPATRLFLQRATAASAEFHLTERNARAVARVCSHLDGIPLALELAAARIGTMTVDQIAERLNDRFALLTRGSRTAMQRHQTLRSLVDWSHDLLGEGERVLLRRLSVFAGGCTLEAAEAVCRSEGRPASETLDQLSRLVEKSLLFLDESSPVAHYGMLETIRQYAAEKLVAADEVRGLRRRHLDYWVGFVERVRTCFYSPEQARWNGLVDSELGNLRVALEWALQPGLADHGLAIINGLHRYWYQNMHWREAVRWIERLREQPTDTPLSEQRVRSLYVAAMLTSNFDPATGRRLTEECLQDSRAAAYDEGIAWSLMWLGYLDSRRREPATRELFLESVACGRRICDPWRRSAVLTQAMICHAGYEALMGRDDAVEAIVGACEREIADMGDDILYTGHCRALLGTLATRRGDYERASRLLGESLAMYRAVNSKFDIAGSLVQQGFLALRRGRTDAALALFKESLPLHSHYPMSPWVTKGLAHLLIARAACQHWPMAARLAGVLGTPAGDAAPPAELSGRAAAAYSDAVRATIHALGRERFEREAGIGAAMTREEAMRHALEP